MLSCTVFTALKPARLSKRFTLTGPATLKKEGGGDLTDGIAEKLIVADLAEFAAMLPTLTPKQALSYGINGHDRARVVTATALAGASAQSSEFVIARTRDHFTWPAGPGLMMLDYDAPPDGPALSPDELRATLAAACPALGDAPAVWRPSASSCIYTKDGAELRGVAGQRLYVAVSDAADIPRALQVLFDRLWLAGFGRYELSKSGAWLARSAIDASVAQPERLDFCGGADCGRGLEQRLPAPILTNPAAPHLDTRAALPDLDAAERQRLAELRESLKQPLRAEQQRIREEWITTRVDARLSAIPETDRAKAKPKLETVYRQAAEGGRLELDFELIVVKKGTQARKRLTVGELLKDRAQYHEATTLDPLEPDYPSGQSRLVGWLNLRATEPYLQSQAHGGTRYLLGREAKQKGGTSYSVGNTGNKVTGLNDKENTCYPIEEDWVTKVTTPRPYYFMIHLDGHKEGGIALKTEELDEGDPRKPGLWYVGTQKEMTPEGETIVHSEPVWVSVPFETLATADDGRGHGYCIAVRFQALHGHQHTWPIPRALLVTEGHEILHRLYAMGFRAMNRPAKANDHLRNYLNSAHPERRALAVSKTGWADSRFVLPDRVFGADRESVFYQVDDPRPSPYTTKGTPAGWRDLVAKVIEPYDLPVFSVSCAFAAPLLSLLDIPSGGFHFMGTSTTGKTTTQNWGLSVWGKPKDLRHNWHGTKVGFELTAAAYSDAVLMLDEIGQADPREVGDLIYMIFNEAGRMRGNARLTHRSLPRWQLLLLSSGEKSLQQLMQDVGKTPMAGQELRLLHIRADAGDGCGILNGLADPLARVELIRQVDAAVTQHHGHPIQTYLTRLAHPDNLTQAADAAQHVKALMLQFATGITSDEAKRAAQRFALVGFAGELASDWQITGWAAGRATQAAECLFHRWLDQWGTATRHDETTFLEHLDAWLSGNSTGHFAEVDPVTRELTMNAERALTSMRPFYGYVANAQDGRVFYLNAAGWQAMTKGFARSLVIETLTAAGRLEKDPKSNKGRVIRIGDRCTTTRYYVIREAGHAE